MKMVQVTDNNNNVIISIEEDDDGSIRGISKENMNICVDGEILDKQKEVKDDKQS